MIEIARYLKQNYYPRFAPDKEPDATTLLVALNAHSSKVIVVQKEGKIEGVAIYLTLNTPTFENIESFDINRVDVLSRLLQQTGDNFHFILVAGNGLANIREGIKIAKKLKPRSISWWNPEMTKLNKYYTLGD